MSRSDTPANRMLVRTLLEGDEKVWPRLTKSGFYMRGKEEIPFLSGARKWPLGAAIARLIRQWYPVEPVRQVESEVRVVLGVRDAIPTMVHFHALGEGGLAVLEGASILFDGEEFGLADARGGTSAIARSFVVAFEDPEAAFEAFGCAGTIWAEHGTREIRHEVQVAEGGEPEVRPFLESAWKLAPRTAPGVPVGHVGCEAMDILLVAIGLNCTHPLREQMIKDGVIDDGENALALIVSPRLQEVSFLDGGPETNNVFDNPTERLDDAGSRYSYSSKEMAELAMAAASEMGIDLAPDIRGALKPLLLSIRPLMTGAWAKEDLIHRKVDGAKLAEWLVGCLSQDRAWGEGVLREVFSLAEQGKEVCLDCQLSPQGNLQLSVLAVGEDTSPISVPLLG